MFTRIAIAAAALSLVATASNAAITGVSGPNSSFGAAPEKLASAPASVTNANQANRGMQGFDEKQNVILPSDISVDGGTIMAGTAVSSHMIFLNKPNGVAGTLSHEDVVWEFDGEILGIMIDINGLDEAASTAVLGAMGTTYGSFNNRGLERNDFVMIDGNKLTVSMFVTQPGDWIRVITAAVPVPAALPLMLAGLAGLGGLSRRKRAKATA